MNLLHKRNTLAQAAVTLCLCGFFLISLNGVSAQCIDSFPYQENFDSGAGGWAASATGTAGWSLGTPNKSVINSAASAPNSWVTGPLFSNYGNNTSSHVESPCFDFSNLNNPVISLNVWWESEFSFDGAALSASTDGGTSWNVVGGFLDPVNWYTDNSVNGGFFGGPCDQGLGWSGQVTTGNGSQGWLTAQHLLNGLAGEPNVLLRICFASDFSSTSDGFAFDDIIIADAPNIDLGPDQSMCFGDTLILNACVPSAKDFQWNTSPVDTFCSKVAVSTNQYIVVVTDTLGFIVRDTINISVSSTFVNLPPDQLICPGDTFFLDAGNPNASHVWQPGNINSQTLEVSETGKYKVTVSDNVGCVKVDSIDIVVDFVPVVDLGEDTTICIGESIQLDAGASNPGTTYSWNFNNASTQTIIVSAPQQYVVVVTTIGNCVASDTMNLGVSLSPVVDLGPDRIECGDFSLNANNAGANFQWSTGESTQIINPPQPGTFWVKVTNQFDCAASDTVMVDQGTIPIVSLGQDKVICNGSGTILDLGNPGQTYFWSNGDTTQTTMVNTPGTYIGQVTNGDGCTAKDTVSVILSPLIVDLGQDLTICEGDSTPLDAGTTGQTYSWSTGESTPVIHPTTGGTYRVTVSDNFGCTARDTIVLTAQSDFDPDFSVSDSAVLYELVQFMDQSGGSPNTWHWDFGDGNTSDLQNPTHTYQSINTFNVCLTASDGVCTNTVCKDVTVDIFEGLEEMLGLEVAIYPNPSHGFFVVDLKMDKASTFTFELLDVNGKTLMKEEPGWIFHSHTEFHTQHLSEGLYLLKISAPEGSLYKKIFIQ